ncbi:MAG: 2-succinyl-5-enolpyruvyl-6-hydroxy-3-cyclohexene-1-carboxylic-acid synthase [Chitinivibrionales bacterium]|nr:2-succinyl-5-enolpyruvyl-6-hydroxy-3-cyclohexene-1-carboxylic-acid synthase [Chitinivibrionales bacterium]
MIDNGALNQFQANLIIEECIRNQVRIFCISPGSRSTPLTIAAARNKRAECVICLDERGAAFHALGIARARNHPAALVCTSGTAVANYYPALVEAFTDAIPLIVLSADRPPELLDTGANQTIDQNRIFGTYVKSFTSLPCPGETTSPAYVLDTIDRAIYTSMAPTGGPVHLNCRFREPLTGAVKDSACNQHLSPKRRSNGNEPCTRLDNNAIFMPSKGGINRLRASIAGAKRPLLCVGRLKPHEYRPIRVLAQKIACPIFADIQSGLHTEHFTNVIPCLDTYLTHSNDERMHPDLIIHIGKAVTSKHLQRFIAESFAGTLIVIGNDGKPFDPDHRCDMRIEGDISIMCKKIAPLLSDIPSSYATTSSRVRQKIVQRLADVFAQNAPALEPQAAYCTAKALPGNYNLFLGSSLPIRHFDSFVYCLHPSVSVAANRGASGIDGTLATAAGFARGSGKPVLCVLGDLSFLHDLNSLHLLDDLPHQFIIVLFNNHGGGIFDFLPVAKEYDVYQRYFKAAHSISFKHAALQFGLDYNLLSAHDQLDVLFAKCLKGGRHTLIEIASRSQDVLRFYDSFYKALAGT